MNAFVLPGCLLGPNNGAIGSKASYPDVARVENPKTKRMALRGIESNLITCDLNLLQNLFNVNARYILRRQIDSFWEPAVGAGRVGELPLRSFCRPHQPHRRSRRSITGRSAEQVTRHATNRTQSLKDAWRRELGVGTTLYPASATSEM